MPVTDMGSAASLRRKVYTPGIYRRLLTFPGSGRTLSASAQTGESAGPGQ